MVLEKKKLKLANHKQELSMAAILVVHIIPTLPSQLVL
jgi:hypothetical protein